MKEFSTLKRKHNSICGRVESLEEQVSNFHENIPTHSGRGDFIDNLIVRGDFNLTVRRMWETILSVGRDVKKLEKTSRGEKVEKVVRGKRVQAKRRAKTIALKGISKSK